MDPTVVIMFVAGALLVTVLILTLMRSGGRSRVVRLVGGKLVQKLPPFT
jgi:hypothetical protein